MRELDPYSESEVLLVAERMRLTLEEVLGKQQGRNLYTSNWLVQRVQEHIAMGDRAIIYLAEFDGEIAGHAIARIETKLSGEKYILFSTIFVTPLLRKQGVASELIRYVQAWADNVGVSQIVYNTAEGNHKLIHLFEQFEYSIVFNVDNMVQLVKNCELDF